MDWVARRQRWALTTSRRQQAPSAGGHRHQADPEADGDRCSDSPFPNPHPWADTNSARLLPRSQGDGAQRAAELSRDNRGKLLQALTRSWIINIVICSGCYLLQVVSIRLKY